MHARIYFNCSSYLSIYRQIEIDRCMYLSFWYFASGNFPPSATSSTTETHIMKKVFFKHTHHSRWMHFCLSFFLLLLFFSHFLYPFLISYQLQECTSSKCVLICRVFSIIDVCVQLHMCVYLKYRGKKVENWYSFMCVLSCTNDNELWWKKL